MRRIENSDIDRNTMKVNITNMSRGKQNEIHTGKVQVHLSGEIKF